ncbi:hypothetical protein QYE76_065806 [Lolium multiflorum]|uniref:DUF4218 domain-containing protein n=1 Tax=Lolium multiflorum TaxID=4521 RepID=A0AAD8W936_LOLMU|nr:hypothetical protein QYE76_065806 [Lolium multiflorum]
MKAKHGWTDTSVDDILEYVKDLLPAGNTCPGSLAEAKRITCPLDLPHEKYHARINDCIMYRKEHVDKTKCPVCDAERYKKGKKKAPRKVVWYFPLAPGCNGWKECPPPGKIRQKPGEKKKKKATVTTPLIGVWKRRSVFWDLPYWKILDTPHCLDVMHITKNVCESLLGTLLNMPDRTKDGPKARHDLKVLGIREELQIPAQEGQSEEEADGGQKRKRIKQPDYYCPPSCFTFSPAEVDQFFNCLLGVRVPFGYSGLISRYMDPKKRNFSGMKSHDCHVMMTQILPVAIRGIMDDHVRATLTGLCNFFDVITRKSISVKKLARLQEEIVVILCELEMYFPPAFFDVMVHLLVHIMDDIVSLGPAFLHNMMPFERMNGVIKGYVRNRSHPDGSIVQGWLTEECISFCTNYLDIEDPVGLPQNKHLRNRIK